MTDLESLVTEWRDAREAILLVNWHDAKIAVAHTHLWTRLGNAEAALMAHARGMRPASEPDSFMMIDWREKTTDE